MRARRPASGQPASLARRARASARARTLLLLASSAYVAVALWNTVKPMPAGTHVVSLPLRLAEVTVLAAPDEILIRELADIDRAAQMVVLDELPRRAQIGQRLLLAKRRRPNLKIVVLADSLDEASGGTPGNTFRPSSGPA